MPLFKKVKKKTGIKNLAFHTFAISGTSVLLVITLVIITIQNYKREDDLIKKQLFSEGTTIISVLETSMQNGMRNENWQPNQIQLLFSEAIKASNIDYLLLVDSTGIIATNSHSPQADDAAFTLDLPREGKHISYVFSKTEDGSDIFNVIKLLNYISLPYLNTADKAPEVYQYILRWNKFVAGRYIVIGLKTEELREAQSEDVLRAIISVIILLVLGSASVFFVFIVQNYYLTNSTLKSLESYTANVVNSIPNGLISLDSEGRVTTLNQIGERLLGLVFSKVQGKRLNDVMEECDLKTTLLSVSDVFEQQMECHLNDGRILPISTTSSMLKNENDEVIGKVIILRDLRDIRKLEKKIERSEHLASLGRMAAGIAHEIRNPLSSIRGFAQYFQKKFEPDSEDAGYALVMVNEVDRLNRVIQDLLNFAKPQEAKLQPVHILDIMEHTLKLMESDVREKKVELVRDFEEGLPEVVADSDMITQVLLNIFINALDAMEENGKLTIAVRKEKEGVNIYVTDTGKGIDKADLRKIFDPFFTLKSGGTGLGLAIVYRIIENHHGEIEVKSEAGEGSTFRIYLP